MGRGGAEQAGRWRRSRSLLPAAALALAALAGAGCGAESHPNEPRPEVSVRVSVTIVPGEVIVQPRSIATGPEKTQQIPQNQNHPQPPTDRKGPLNVTLVAANQTGEEARLALRGPTDASSDPIYPRSPGTLHAELPTGTYLIAASGVPGARPAKLTVGPYRASSENDVLLP
jgi:hypothetical protein